MTVEPSLQVTDTPELTDRVDRVLITFLETCEIEMEATVEGGRALAEEIGRLIRAGGKRLRPAFCYWGFRAAGGVDNRGDGDAIIRASAAMELLHTMALVHDDVLDGTTERRGAPTTAPLMAERAPTMAPGGDPESFGLAAAVLVGDLAAVLADRLLLESGFDPEALARALAVYHHMRIDTAAGQFLDVAGRGDDPARARAIARLKGGAYTVEGPLLVGAAFAAGEAEVLEALRRYGRALGEAFQLADDLRDQEAGPGVDVDAVNDLVGAAVDAVSNAPIAQDARMALERMALAVAVS